MKVSWDDYSQYMEKYNMFQTTNQIVVYIHWLYTMGPSSLESGTGVEFGWSIFSGGVWIYDDFLNEFGL